MYSFELDIDFNKLEDYFSGMDESQIKTIKSSGKVAMFFELLTKARVDETRAKFLGICKDHNLSGHYNELLYLLLIKKEDIALKLEVYERKYKSDVATKDIASLILAYRQLDPDKEIQVHLRTNTGGVKINSNIVARWMVETTCKLIEDQEFSPSTFGVQTFRDLFGDNPFDGNELTDMRLVTASNLKPRKPNLFVNRLYVELFTYLQDYLNTQTRLKIKPGKILSDFQALFFFDILELYYPKISFKRDSTPKDYIYVMFQNEVKRVKNQAILKSKI